MDFVVIFVVVIEFFGFIFLVYYHASGKRSGEIISLVGTSSHFILGSFSCCMEIYIYFFSNFLPFFEMNSNNQGTENIKNYHPCVLTK